MQMLRRWTRKSPVLPAHDNDDASAKRAKQWRIQQSLKRWATWPSRRWRIFGSQAMVWDGIWTISWCFLVLFFITMLFVIYFAPYHSERAWRAGRHQMPSSPEEYGNDISYLESAGWTKGITIATHLSLDRKEAWYRLSKIWKGPLAVVWLARTTDEAQQVVKIMQGSDAAYSILFRPGIKTRQYPVNTMRNLVIELVHTELILLIDADFVPASSVWEYFTDPLRYETLAYQAGVLKQLLVLPMFEYYGTDATLPLTLDALYTSNRTQANYKGAAHRGHRAVDYDEWDKRTKEGQCDDIYRIFWERHFEPYFVVWRGDLPQLDTRFVSYGMDKAAQAMHLKLLGYTFHVVPCQYLIHVEHEASAWLKDRQSLEKKDQQGYESLKLQQKRTYQKIEATLSWQRRLFFWFRDHLLCSLWERTCDWV